MHEPEEPQDEFQPTLPARGATTSPTSSEKSTAYFNPRSPHGERHQEALDIATERLISTHAPRTGSDPIPLDMADDIEISTHAPRTGSD